MIRILGKLILVLAGAVIVAVGALLIRSPDPQYALESWLGAGRFHSYDALITETAKRHGVDPMLIKAVVWRESKFHPDKMGTSGERGLMQVGEAAAKDWAKAWKVETFVPTDLFDAKTNVEIGTWYLSRALERWKGKDDPVPFALAEYNAGKSRVDRWIGKLPAGEAAPAGDFVTTIDIPSTRRYVEDITARYRYYQPAGKM